MSSRISNNTALIIGLYKTTDDGNAPTVNINGPGRKHIKTIIWYCEFCVSVHFNSNATKKRTSFEHLFGPFGRSIMKVSRNEFGRNANNVMSFDTATSTIYIQ